MTRSTLTRPLFFAAAIYTLGGAYVHMHEWFKGYRHIPSSVAGSWVVRIGFPVNAVISVALAVGLVLAATAVPRLAVPALVATAGFQVASLATLIATRVSSVFGWAEPLWTPGANQTRAVEIGTIVVLALTALLYRLNGPVVGTNEAGGRC